MSDKAQCPECGTEQLLKNDGTIRKHGDCPGAGQPPASAAEPTQPDDAQLDPQADDEGDDGWDDPELDDEPDSAPPGPAVEDLDYGQGTYRWQLTVREPCPYLKDVAWHQANTRMAAAQAEAAGHTPRAEAQCTSVAAGTEPGTLVLTYTLPVERP